MGGLHGRYASTGLFLLAGLLGGARGQPCATQAYINAPNAGAVDRFARSTALHGDTLVIGAFAEDSCSTSIVRLSSDLKQLQCPCGRRC